MKLKRKLRKGFTLVELVVVIAVIAILAAVSVGAYFGVTNSANSSNATAGAKQVKDLWTMYSVSEYDNSWSAERNAKEFCLKYVEDNGPDYYVNYTKVSVNAVNNEIQSRVGREESNSDAILYVVETTYPTWFLVSGLNIIEEGTPSKNNEEFINSLMNSTRISEESKSKFTEEDFNFDIETIRIDESTGRKIRGFKYYNITIDKTNDEDDSFFIKPNESIYSVDRPEYARGEAQNDNGFIHYTFSLYDGSSEIYSTDPIILEEDLENAFPVEDTSEEYAFGYVVASKTYLYKSNTDFDLSDYAFVLATATGYSTEPYDTVVEDNRVFGVGSIVTTRTYGASNIQLTYIQNENYLLSDDFNELSLRAQAEEHPYFLFVNTLNSKVSETITLNKNIVLMVGHYHEETSFTSMVSQSLRKIITIKKGLFSETTEEETKLFSDNFDDITDSSVLDRINPTQGGALSKISFLEDTENTKYLKSKLTIESSGKLIVKPGAYICVDGKISFPQSGTTLQVKERGEIVNNGEIQLGIEGDDSGAKLRALSRISGTGKITTYGKCEIFELIKFRDFYGGTHASTSIQKEIFPYNDYLINNVQCELYLNNLSFISVKSGVHMSSTFLATNKIIFIGNSDQSGFFTMSNDALICKKVDGNQAVINIKDGELNDGNINVAFEPVKIGTSGLLDSLKDLITKAKVDTSTTNIPVANVKLVVENGGILNISNKRENSKAFEILPSSELFIQEGGKVIVGQNSKVALLTPSIFETIINNPDGVCSVPDGELFDTFKDMVGENNVSMVTNNGTLVIDGDVYVNSDGTYTDNDLNYNLYNHINFVSAPVINNTSDNTYSYSYLGGTVDSSKKLTITISKLNLNQI